MRSVRHRRARAIPGLATIALIGLLLAGCSAASSDGSTAYTPSETNVRSSAPQDETPRDDMTRESVAPWARYEKISANQLRFFSAGGDPACYGVRVATQETDTTIEVATLVGTKPGAPAECTLVASLSSVLVTTDKPIGTRAVTHLKNPPLIP